MVGKIRLIVAVEDEIYLDRLCDYLETSHGRFITERFSDKTALSAALRSEQGYDAILFEPDMLDSIALRSIDKIKVLLGEMDSMELIDGCYSVREYQKTDAIASAILNICSLDKRFIGIEVHVSDKAKLFMFTSPVGGSGVTTVSLAAAMHLAKQDKKVLYINLEQIPSINALIPAGGITMTQVTRMAIESNPKLLTAVEGGKITEPLSGLEYFDGFGDMTDFDSLKPEHLRSLASKLSSLGRYDAIIADVAWNTVLTAPLLETSEKVFLVSRNTNLSVARVNSFLQYANEKELSYRNRLYVVINALSGSPNSTLAVTPAAVIPMYQMVIDTTSFAATVLNSGTFSHSFNELARQL